jgi:hypothetical protein
MEFDFVGEMAMPLIDPALWLKRQTQMALNIRKLLPVKGTSLVLTGGMHLEFFQKQFPKAIFPFRNK